MKKYLLIILSIFFLGLILSSQIAFAYTTIVQDYPELPACKGGAPCRPGEEDFGLPQFIKYIYIFAIGTVGVIGFVAIIMAAFGYVTSAGNPQKASDAKDKIISALLGIVLLLGSVVLLRMINPDLLKLKMEAPPVEVKVSTKVKVTPATGCRLLTVSWNKGVINAGESARAIFQFSQECKGKNLLSLIKEWPGPQQLREGGGKDAYCGEYFQGWRAVAEKLQTEANFIFNSQCNETWIGTSLSACVGTGDLICNFAKDKPETFYIEGKVIVESLTQSIPRLPITVQDLKDDGKCCK